EEVAGEAEVERLAQLFLEALQPSDRLEPDTDVQLVREQRADAAGTVSGRAAGQRLALEEERPAAAELRKVAERRGSHHASADDDHVGALVHGAMIADV